MKQVQLVEVLETILYIKDGRVIAAPKDQKDKLLHSISGETKVMRSETVIERWIVKTKKEADKRFWDWCEENKKDFRNYFVVHTE